MNMTLNKSLRCSEKNWAGGKVTGSRPCRVIVKPLEHLRCLWTEDRAKTQHKFGPWRRESLSKCQNNSDLKDAQLEWLQRPYHRRCRKRGKDHLYREYLKNTRLESERPVPAAYCWGHLTYDLKFLSLWNLIYSIEIMQQWGVVVWMTWELQS